MHLANFIYSPRIVLLATFSFLALIRKDDVDFDKRSGLEQEECIYDIEHINTYGNSSHILWQNILYLLPWLAPTKAQFQLASPSLRTWPLPIPKLQTED